MHSDRACAEGVVSTLERRKQAARSWSDGSRCEQASNASRLSRAASWSFRRNTTSLASQRSSRHLFLTPLSFRVTSHLACLLAVPSGLAGGQRTKLRRGPRRARSRPKTAEAALSSDNLPHSATAPPFLPSFTITPLWQVSLIKHASHSHPHPPRSHTGSQSPLPLLRQFSAHWGSRSCSCRTSTYGSVRLPRAERSSDGAVCGIRNAA